MRRRGTAGVRRRPPRASWRTSGEEGNGRCTWPAHGSELRADRVPAMSTSGNGSTNTVLLRLHCSSFAGVRPRAGDSRVARLCRRGPPHSHCCRAVRAYRPSARGRRRCHQVPPGTDAGWCREYCRLSGMHGERLRGVTPTSPVRHAITRPRIGTRGRSSSAGATARGSSCGTGGLCRARARGPRGTSAAIDGRRRSAPPEPPARVRPAAVFEV